MKGRADQPPTTPLAEEAVDKLEVNAVIPAKAGVQRRTNVENTGVPPLDPGFRRDDVQTDTRSQRKATVPEGEGARPDPGSLDFGRTAGEGMPISVAPSRSAFREYAEALIIAFILALVIRGVVVQAFKIPSGSMLPTLQIGDHILVNKFIYGLRLPVLGTAVVPGRLPQRGDIVVFVYPVDPSKDFIKRVVALPGEVVQVRDKTVYVNGKKLDDRHAFHVDGSKGSHAAAPRDNYGPVTVPERSLFVMGDNRDRSYDSRFWGFVDIADVRGKAFLVYWSWAGGDRWVRWERIGKLID